MTQAKREHVRVRAHADGAGHGLLGRGVADGSDRDAAERGGEPLRAGDAEIGDLEDFGLAEAAAQDVARREVAVDDAHAVDREHARGQATHQVRDAVRFEREARAIDAVGDALLERRALDAAVHVLDGEPGRRRRSGPCSGAAPVSTSRTTNGVGGTRSFRRPSATASFCTSMPGSASAGPVPKPARTILITTGERPSGA